MKRYITRPALLLSLGVVLLASNGCQKLEDFGDLNVNPNGVGEPITSALLTNAQASLTGLTTTQPPSLFCQYWAENTYPGTSKYAGLNIDAQGIYSGTLQDLQVIIDRNMDPSFAPKAAQYGDNNSQIAIAKILKSFVMWAVTDRWGDVPYSEANKGSLNLLPKYDTQEEIYTGLIADLNDALTKLNPSGVTVSGDIVYSGNVAQWGKLANSLKILIALRTSKRYPAAGGWAANIVTEATNNSYGYITSNADNFQVKYPGGAFQNPFFALSTNQDVAVALTYTDILNNMNDTRRTTMATLANGCPYGLTNAAPIATPYARITNGPRAAADGPVVYINAASVLLARAEALERGWIPGGTADAKIAYDAAVTASFAEWSVAVPGGFLTAGPANYETGAGGGAIGGASVVGSTAATTTKLQRIHLQQYIAFYPSGIQGWSNWRRTGFPDLKPTIFATNDGGQIPRRYTYGVLDYQNNKDQVDIAVERMGGEDDQDTRVWWDQ